MGVRYRYLLSLIVYLLVFNSISTVILHNEIVIETSSSSSSSPTDTSSQSSSSHTSNEAADLKKTGDDPDPGVEKLVEVPPAAADVVNDAQSQSQPNDPTPPNSPPSSSQTTTSESGTSGETVESSAQISPPTDQTNQTAEANSTTTNKSSQAEMVRAAAGVVVVNKAGGEEMQSFEEWKEMRLKSSASSSAQDKSTTSTSSSSTDPNSAGSAESATSGSGLPITSSSTQTASQSAHEDSPHQRRKNYASAECGAKIIASNPESNKPSNILSENKDDYMLNSCSNRVWFVVELCEPIRVIELELANFELFSNVPKQFRVYASERYVASSASSPNWPQKYLVGTFEAANVRTVQKFAIKDAIKETTPTTNTNQVDVNQSQQPNSSSPEQPNSNSNSHLLHNQNILMYAKYVRFEMLSHYGSEHYCPLSLVRIFGTSISDDEEAAAAAVSSSETDEVESRSIHVESSSTTQATTTTTKNSKDEEKVNFLNLRLVKERVNLFAKSSQFLSNIIATFLAENFNLSKLFTVFSSNTDKNAANSASTTFSPPSTDSTSTTQQLDTSSSTKLTTLPPFDRRNQVLQIDLHKVLCFSSMRNTLDCCQCLPEDDEKSSTTATFMIRPYQTTTTTTTNNWMSKYCGYYFLMITSAQAQLNTSLLFKFLNNIKYSNGEAPLQLHPSNFTRFSLNNVNYYILNEWLDNQTAAHFYFKKSPSSETNPTPQNEEHSTLNLNMFASSLDGRNITSPPIIEPNEVNETNENSNSTIEVKPTPSIVDETPSLESTPQQQQQQQSQEEPVVDVNEGSKNVETSTSSPPLPPPPENQDTTSTSTSTSTNNNNAQIPTVVTPVIIGNGKDAVLMRLSNRVKILELNMTLSSQYLEKLSQHYKKQMDEMQRAFNVTTSALLETIRIADERDLKQNERIVTIERRVEKMQNSMEALENLLNDLKFQTDILIWTIIVILNIIILIEVVRWLRNAFSSSSPSPSSKPNKTLNRTISSQQSSARIHLSASEIEALIEERVRRATESLREELIEQQRQKQFTTTTTMTEPPSTPQRVETLTPTTTTSLESAMAQPQAAAAAAAVVSSTLATVVAIAAAATAQCSTLGAQHHGEEKS